VSPVSSTAGGRGAPGHLSSPSGVSLARRRNSADRLRLRTLGIALSAIEEYYSDEEDEEDMEDFYKDLQDESIEESDNGGSSDNDGDD
ncbi:hypothetical protein EJB05_27873, partial [Eragrostis curvula]